MKINEECEKVTLTTGPFLLPSEIPFVPLGQRLINRIVLTLKNPTDQPLEAGFKITVCQSNISASPSLGLPNPLFVLSDDEVVFAKIPLTTVSPMSCSRFEFDITPTVPLPGLFRLEPVASFGYEDFVLCEKECDHEDCCDEHCFPKAILTSGPLLIPIGPQPDRLVVILKNPTNKPLRAALEISICQQIISAPPTPILPPLLFASALR